MEMFKDIMDYLDSPELGENSPEFGESAYWSKFYEEHGAFVEVRQEAYCDVKIYEDGYEERYYIGD